MSGDSAAKAHYKRLDAMDKAWRAANPDACSSCGCRPGKGDAEDGSDHEKFCTIKNSFDLDPDINWPTPEEFEVIRAIQEEGLIQETCPSPRAWHFLVIEQAAWERLPNVCKELAS